jgi:hypothetical protein
VWFFSLDAASALAVRVARAQWLEENLPEGLAMFSFPVAHQACSGVVERTDCAPSTNPTYQSTDNNRKKPWELTLRRRAIAK